MGFARATEDFIRQTKGMPKGSKLDTSDKVIASAVGGALGVWNMPLEVIRVEMQSMNKLQDGSARPQKLTMLSTLKYIYKGKRVAHSLSFSTLQNPAFRFPNGRRHIVVSSPRTTTPVLTYSFTLKENGVKGLFRGATPRIGLGVWRVSRSLSSTGTQSPS